MVHGGPKTGSTVETATLETRWLSLGADASLGSGSIMNPMHTFEALSEGTHELLLIVGETLDDKVLADLRFDPDGWTTVGGLVNSQGPPRLRRSSSDHTAEACRLSA